MAPSTVPDVSVSTVAATATCTGHHLLKIEGYKHLKGIHGNASYFESCRFDAGGHAWKIYCYPNGNRSDTAGYFSVFLTRDDDEGEPAAAGAVHAKIRFALVHLKFRLLPLPWPPYAASGTCTFSSRNTSRGFWRFIGVKRLERSGFLKDDCLAVRCDVTVVEKSAVKDEVVRAADMARLGMLCKCKDDLCKRHHRA